jgi:beta-lactamase regulating signal transducer with metallopeptidase domain
MFAAGAVVLLLTMPSFLYLEPHAVEEAIGLGGLAMALCGAGVIVVGFVSAVAAWWRASRFVHACTANSRRLDAGVGVPAFEVSCAAPALLVSGVYRPRLLVSGRAAELLSPSEMEVAIRHEMAHVRGRDNLKKMVLRFCAFPFLAALEREWLMAAEMAADDAAVTDQRTALDLASALIKIARASAGAPAPELAMSLVPEKGARLSVRVQRLLTWQRPVSARSPHWRKIAVLAGLAAVLVVVNYSWVLAQMHEFTELLMR